jgi:hypothetical protein
MRSFFVATLMATIIGVLVATAAIAHEGWFGAYVRQKLKQIESIWLSPAADRASAGLGLRGERGMRAISRAAFAQCQSSISVGSPPQCRATYNLTPMSVSGTVTISSTAWNSMMITRFAKRIGTILMIVPARWPRSARPNIGKPFS